jgi:cysteine desulfurase
MSRDKISKSLNAKNYNVIFTSGSTEANNMALSGCESNKILLSSAEHASVNNCRPNKKKIVHIKTLGNSLIDISDLEKKLNNIKNKNFLVAACLVNNETGVIQNVKKIAQMVHQKGGLIHSDIVQAVGKIRVDLDDLDVDFASISSHKIRGPQGVGALLVKKSVEIKPLIYGSKQENSKRAGTHNVAGIVGFGEACAMINIEEYSCIKNLRDFLEKSLKEIAGCDVKFFGDDVERIVNTSYIGLSKSDKKKQLDYFNAQTKYKICVNDASGCSSGGSSESHVLKAMGVKDDFLNSAVRVSLGIENTMEEVKKFILIWKGFYDKTR